jgi:hypothetical protein
MPRALRSAAGAAMHILGSGAAYETICIRNSQLATAAEVGGRGRAAAALVTLLPLSFLPHYFSSTSVLVSISVN